MTKVILCYAPSIQDVAIADNNVQARFGAFVSSLDPLKMNKVVLSNITVYLYFLNMLINNPNLEIWIEFNNKQYSYPDDEDKFTNAVDQDDKLAWMDFV